MNKRQQLRVQHEMMTSTERSAATWLEKWSNEATNSAKKKLKPTKKQIINKPSGMPVSMPQQLPDQTLRQLQMLYKMATSSTNAPETITTSPATTTTAAEASDAASHLQQRLKAFKSPANVDELQTLNRKPTGKTKDEITKELMDVNLEE